MAKTVIAFDLYGTILSTESISRELEGFYGPEKAKVIASQARRYQLEYTWRSNSMGMYRPFDVLTRSSFHHAAAEAGVKISPAQEQAIMKAYNGLDAFPDVQTALELISKSQTLEAWIFSNGTESMIASSVETSRGLATASSPDTVSAARIVSVDPLGVYKPSPKTYQHMVATVSRQDAPEKVWLVSSNPFDALGAVAAGMSSVWVDRGETGWIDGLSEALDVRPTVVVHGVDEAVEHILKQA
ncbi:unnamed protein product [Clonostachys rhizophaga]|uniref:Haloacid dehalogenase n=1 Tax=Clonostachys rhizophaga TaxID=160324 RepID=A0A9N9W0Y0_9HYPO|nr:unnamed protein product [Clonostachys rhizophaga]